MSMHFPERAKRLLARIVISAFAVQSTFSAAAPLSISEKPLWIPSDLPPNLAVTLDDSGSMQFAYAPDNRCGSVTGDGNTGLQNTKRFKSAYFNPIYYNPAITYPQPLDVNGNPLTTTFTAAWWNGYAQSQGTVDLASGYLVSATVNPAAAPSRTSGLLNFVGRGGCSDTGNLYALHPNASPFVTASDNTSAKILTARQKRVAAYYYNFKPSLTGCDGTANDEDCYEYVQVPDAEKQNFANWYSFYRTRNFSVVAGASRAFSSLDSSVRVAWQALNSCNAFNGSCAGWSGTSSDNRIRKFESTHRGNFYSWLFRLPANSGTPLRGALKRAGDYFTTSGISSPYAEDPQVTLGSEWGCRQSYSLLMTDGYWNTDSNASFSSIGNSDGTDASLPDGKSAYSKQNPYYDANSPTLADIAFHYWKTDLRTDLPNKVPEYIAEKSGDAEVQRWNPKNDPATWQHMVTFTVGFGLKNSLASSTPTPLVWAGDTYSGSYNTGGGTSTSGGLAAGHIAWPAPSNDSANNVSDLWHAALNSRGQFFPADSPEELLNAFQTIINRVQEKPGSAAAFAANSGRFRISTNLYQPVYNPAEWSGDLRKISIKSDGTLPTPDDGGVYPADWSAANKLTSPDFNTRNIVTSVGSATDTKGVDFTASGLTSAGVSLDFLKVLSGDSAALTQARLDWLRGSAANEGVNLNLRKRTSTKLGDIVNSSPVYVGSAGGSSAAVGDSSYSAFTSTHCAGSNQPSTCSGPGRTAAVFLGANDGMLHAFKESDGSELFAYVPEAVQDRLKYLTQSGYTHRFYVDGTPTVMDIKVGSTWKTVLASGLNAGGRGIFVLDVTKPESMNAGSVIWEFNAKNANPGPTASPTDDVDTAYGSKDLGYTFAEPVIAKMPNGRPAVIFGNGYNSTSEQGFLFIKYLDDKTTAPVKIPTDTVTSNGLSSPSVVDIDNNGTADYAYAGDLQGRMWKFNLSTNTRTLLFTALSGAGAKQPITTAPAILPHPRGGVMVVFGTGQAIQSSDLTDTTGMTIYGLWDEASVGSLARNLLESRPFTQVSSNGNTYRILGGAPISWYSSSNTTGKKGWYIDLPDQGERIIAPGLFVGNEALFLSAIPPTNICDAGGSSWVMKFDALTGSPLPYEIFDVNGDKKFDSADQISGKTASAIKQGKPSGITVLQPTAISGPGSTQVLVSGSGELHMKPGRITGRMHWRDVLQQ